GDLFQLGGLDGAVGHFKTGSGCDEETLIKIASITGGDFFRARDISDLRDAFKSIDTLEKTEVEHSSWIQVKEYYHWFLIPTALGLMIYFFAIALNPPPFP
ncbi:hypothetical protein N9Z40_05435, partial [Akkermansiaceae bacterium]|nr:hypothetical protein [Akkermansiaceae bacterium]